MLPTGHEGPYSLDDLEKRLRDKKLNAGVQVWREGLPVSISLVDVLNEVTQPSVPEEEDELPPPLPPLPTEEDEPEIPEISLLDGYEAPKAPKKIPVALILSALVSVLVVFGLFQWMKDREKISLRRHPKMTLELHQKIETSLKFEGFDKKIFFHEYTSPDLTHLWLVTNGFQKCDIEAVFHSVKDRLLTMADEEVEMTSRGKLAGHVAELSIFEFRKGARIIPGLYEMEVKARRCEWDGIVPKIRNMFSRPDQEYTATTRVVLYPRGTEEFQQVLTQLMKKKEELKKQTESQESLFWEDLQMKFQTLHAMTLQIEQLLLDFIDQGERNFSPRLKAMVNTYTQKFGQGLTQFVIENEGYFEGLAATDLRPLILKKDYESLVRLTSKEIGFEAMKVIEKLQTMKKPTTKELKALRPAVLKTFESLKNSINKKLLDVTEDRSKQP